MTEVIQTKVRQGQTEMITWLPVDKRVKVGTVLTLDKVEGEWTVIEQFTRMDKANINRGWNNNI